jgi:L-rhamnose mutarotase
MDIIDYKDYSIFIDRDESCHPRNNDNVLTMAVWHNEYILGDVRPEVSPDKFKKFLLEEFLDDIAEQEVETLWQKNFYSCPLYLYSHGGITISREPFGCAWDSGQIGFMYVSKKDAEKKLDLKPDQNWFEILDKVAANEIRDYDNYLQGNGWVYKIVKQYVPWSESYFDYSKCLEAAKQEVDKNTENV